VRITHSLLRNHLWKVVHSDLNSILLSLNTTCVFCSSILLSNFSQLIVRIFWRCTCCARADEEPVFPSYQGVSMIPTHPPPPRKARLADIPVGLARIPSFSRRDRRFQQAIGDSFSPRLRPRTPPPAALPVPTSAIPQPPLLSGVPHPLQLPSSLLSRNLLTHPSPLANSSTGALTLTRTMSEPGSTLFPGRGFGFCNTVVSLARAEQHVTAENGADAPLPPARLTPPGSLPTAAANGSKTAPVNKALASLQASNGPVALGRTRSMQVGRAPGSTHPAGSGRLRVRSAAMAALAQVQERARHSRPNLIPTTPPPRLGWTAPRAFSPLPPGLGGAPGGAAGSRIALTRSVYAPLASGISAGARFPGLEYVLAVCSPGEEWNNPTPVTHVSHEAHPFGVLWKGQFGTGAESSRHRRGEVSRLLCSRPQLPHFPLTPCQAMPRHFAREVPACRTTGHASYRLPFRVFFGRPIFSPVSPLSIFSLHCGSHHRCLCIPSSPFVSVTPNA